MGQNFRRTVGGDKGLTLYPASSELCPKVFQQIIQQAFQQITEITVKAAKNDYFDGLLGKNYPSKPYFSLFSMFQENLSYWLGFDHIDRNSNHKNSQSKKRIGGRSSLVLA
jgi:hypothetical protein